MIEELKPLLSGLYNFSKKRMGFSDPPQLFLKNDSINSQKALGRTAHYDPSEKSITLYMHSRHPKDILRSFAHELVHHHQNLRGDLTPEKIASMGKNYAQEDDHMRNMEKEAYLQGNMCFRDWEDGLEDKELILIKIAESKIKGKNKKMNSSSKIKNLENIIREQIKSIISEQDNRFNKKLKDLKKTAANIKRLGKDKFRKGFLDAELAATYKMAGDDIRKRQQVFNIGASLGATNPGRYGIFKDGAMPDGQEYFITTHYKNIDGRPNSIGQMALDDPSFDPYDAIAKSKYLFGDDDNDGEALASAEPTLGMGGSGAGSVGSVDLDGDGIEVTGDAGGDMEVTSAPTVTAGTPTIQKIDGAYTTSEGKRRQAAILRRGDLGGKFGMKTMQDLQKFLITSGFLKKTYKNRKGKVVSSADGDYGDMTRKAIIDFQERIGAKPDGVIGTNTLEKFRPIDMASLPNQGAGATQSTSQSTMTVGDVIEREIKSSGRFSENDLEKLRGIVGRKFNNPLKAVGMATVLAKYLGYRPAEIFKELENGTFVDTYTRKIPADLLSNEEKKIAQQMTNFSDQEGLAYKKQIISQFNVGRVQENKNTLNIGENKKVKTKITRQLLKQMIKSALTEQHTTQEEMKEAAEESVKKKGATTAATPKTDKVENEPVEQVDDGNTSSGKDESKIETPEQEGALYEQRFTPKNNRLFEKLLKEWTK